MGSGYQLRLCETCKTYTKHDSIVTPETVTKTCQRCGRKLVSNRAEYAKRVAKVRKARARYQLENPERREDT